MTHILIDNLKCGGCANSIKTQLLRLDGVQEVVVNKAENAVDIVHTEGVSRQTLTDTLARLGYPETGSTQGFDALGAQVKSFVSCAIGRLTDTD